MARIRSVKPEFWSSEQVMECSPIARLLFIGLWNFCDDAGNHVASLRTIKAEIFPGDDIDSSNVRRLLDELVSNGLIVNYSAENKDFLHVTGWHHQKIDRPTYKHPPYPGDESEATRRTIVESSPPEGKGEEGKGEERRGEELALTSGEPPKPPEPSAIELPLNDGTDFPVTVAQVSEFAQLYPAVDVMQELRSMRAWSLTNPTKRKTRTGVMRFVNGWLAKQQDSPRHPTVAKSSNNSLRGISA